MALYFLYMSAANAKVSRLRMVLVLLLVLALLLLLFLARPPPAAAAAVNPAAADSRARCLQMCADVVLKNVTKGPLRLLYWELLFPLLNLLNLRSGFALAPQVREHATRLAVEHCGPHVANIPCHVTVL